MPMRTAFVFSVLIFSVMNAYSELPAPLRPGGEVVRVNGGEENPPFALGDYCYFIAGRALWRTDGTHDGTALFADLTDICRPHTYMMAEIGNVVVFPGTITREPETDPEDIDVLVRSDGTPEGTYLLFEEPTLQYYELDRSLQVLNNHAFFTAKPTRIIGAKRYLWRTDGTFPGTVVVTGNDANGRGGEIRREFGLYQGAFYYVAQQNFTGVELYRSYGTSESSGLFKELQPDSSSGFTEMTLPVVDDYLYFVEEGRRIIRVDGIPDNTKKYFGSGAPIDNIAVLSGGLTTFIWDGGRVEHIDESTGDDIELLDTAPVSLVSSGHGMALFQVYQLTAGISFGVTDGTAENSKVIAKTRNNEQAGIGNVFDGVTAQNGDFFFADFPPDDDPQALWTSDGTLEGSGVVIAELPESGYFVPRGFAAFNGLVLTTGVSVDERRRELHYINIPPVVESIMPDGPVEPGVMAFRLRFSEAVSNVDADDLELIAASVGGAFIAEVLPEDAKTYRVHVGRGTGAGTLALRLNDDDSIEDTMGLVLEGIRTDDGTFTGDPAFELDDTAPGATLASPLGDQVDSSPFAVQVHFDEVVFGFDASSVTVSNGAAILPSGSGAEYSVLIVPDATGTVGIQVEAGAVYDASANPNTASNLLAITFGDPSEGAMEGEGQPEAEASGDGEGTAEGEGSVEGQENEGEGEENTEGQPDGNPDGEGSMDGEVQAVHTADQNADNLVNLSELLRVIQFFNSAGFGCEAGTEDGYAPNDLDIECVPHASDYNPQDWEVSLSELLRLIQFFNSGGYSYCPDDATEDDFCPGPSR